MLIMILKIISFHAVVIMVLGYFSLIQITFGQAVEGNRISFSSPFILRTLQISIGWLSVISSVIPLALKVILPTRIIHIGKII